MNKNQFNKERETIKKNQKEILQLKNKTELKNSTERFNNRLDHAEESENWKADHLKLASYRNKKQNKKREIKKTKEGLCELWDTIKHMNIHIMGVAEEEKGGKKRT